MFRPAAKLHAALLTKYLICISSMDYLLQNLCAVQAHVIAGVSESTYEKRGHFFSLMVIRMVGCQQSVDICVRLPWVIHAT